jgi:NAD(P)-dependent dehydrogenase (short-subunit alcohol dehydrogenase family)
MAQKILEGQVAIITGGSRGIGRAAVEQLAALGAATVISARNEGQVQQVASALREQGAKSIGVPCDVAEPEQAKALVDATLAEFGRVDILVNNAGIIWPVEEVVSTDPEAWTHNIRVNLFGPFYLVRNVLPLMVAQKHGRIVNVSSGAGVNPIVGASAYSSAKAALDMFTRATAQELQDSGVTINSFHPGMVDTEMQTDLRSVDTTGAHFSLNRFHDAHQQGLLRSPQQVARAVCWLAGPWSKDQSGVIFKIQDEEWIRQVHADLGV